MAMERGPLSINSENMFPIIKKWLYSDHDIFYRELISNGCDAITKLKKLDIIGETELPEDYKPRIDVVVSAADKTITVTDNGLGMSAAEVDEYINRIAFSGARDFLETYKDKTNEDQIIGHFGLGFYSAFMVADSVTIDTKSWKADEPAVFWSSEGGQQYEMSTSDRAEVGSTITLYLNEDSLEFANEYRAKEVLMKYCAFMPFEIYLTNADRELVKEKKEPESYDEMAEDLLDSAEERVKKDEENAPQPVNETDPLWNRTPKDCSDEEYKKFYRTTFNDYKEPIFWIHLNMDYPFRLKGILYFPRITSEYDSIEGTIKLYNNQVFVADNIKEVIPEYLLILKGVIDCPDLPLNVSRSALQNDGFVKKISEYITKKVADKLSGMFKTDRENYEKAWDDIAPFVKFGYIRDEKFREKIEDFILYKDLNGDYLTLDQLAGGKEDALEEKSEDAAAEAEAPAADEDGGAVDEDADAAGKETTVFYVSNEKTQIQYIDMFRSAGKTAVYLGTYIDPNFIQTMEMNREGLRFAGIDTALDSDFREELDEEDEAYKADSEKLSAVFRKALSDAGLAVSAQRLKDNDIASMITAWKMSPS